MNIEKLRDHWVAEMTPPPAAGADGAAGEPLLQALIRELGAAAIPILRPDPEHTWIWSDLHLGDRAMVDAWNRPFRNLTHMNRELLAEVATPGPARRDDHLPGRRRPSRRLERTQPAAARPRRLPGRTRAHPRQPRPPHA